MSAHYRTLSVGELITEFRREGRSARARKRPALSVSMETMQAVSDELRRRKLDEVANTLWREHFILRGAPGSQDEDILRELRTLRDALLHARVADPMAVLSFGRPRDFTYEFLPDVERCWKGRSGRVYIDKEGWLRHPSLKGLMAIRSAWFMDGPLVEVART